MAKKKSVSPVFPSDDEWQAMQDMRTLMDAKTIQSNEKRHAAAQQKALDESRKLQAVAGKSYRKAPESVTRSAPRAKVDGSGKLASSERGHNGHHTEQPKPITGKKSSAGAGAALFNPNGYSSTGNKKPTVRSSEKRLGFRNV